MEENTKISPPQTIQDTPVVNPELNEEKVLFEWTSPERAFQRRNKDFWVTAIAILVLVSVIFIMVQEFYLVIALVSVLFLYYVLSTVPPEDIGHKITNRGVYFGEANYSWDLLERFWFGKSLGWDTLFIETKLRFPPQVSLIIDPKDKDKLQKILVKRIPMVQSSPSFVDKLTKWFATRLPLETRTDTDTQPKNQS
jgi:hypothetical protein